MTSSLFTWLFISEIRKLSLNSPSACFLRHIFKIFCSLFSSLYFYKHTFVQPSLSFCQNYCRISLLLLLCPSNPVSREQQQKLNQTLHLKSFSDFPLFLNQYLHLPLWPTTPCMMWLCHSVQPQFMPSFYWLISGHTDLFPIPRRYLVSSISGSLHIRVLLLGLFFTVMPCFTHPPAYFSHN